MLIWLSYSAQIFKPNLILDVSLKVLWMRFTFKLMDFEESRLPSIMWSVGFQFIENINSSKCWPCPSMRKFTEPTSFGLYLQSWFFLAHQRTAFGPELQQCPKSWGWQTLLSVFRLTKPPQSPCEPIFKLSCFLSFSVPIYLLFVLFL